MKFSFVILTWNRFKFLEICIRELLHSIDNLADSEVIILDNGSTDETAEILAKYSVHNNIKIISGKSHRGLNAYKTLFGSAKGDYIVVIDDDVLEFPKGLDKVFEDYMAAFPDYGFVALNVIQNEFTNGAKPGREAYIEETRNEKTIEQGPTGGWCTCFRKKDYRKIRLIFYFINLNMKRGEDGILNKLFGKVLKLKSGIIKDSYCFHASGPYYAKQYGHIEREIEKYSRSGLKDFVQWYKRYE